MRLYPCGVLSALLVPYVHTVILRLHCGPLLNTLKLAPLGWLMDTQLDKTNSHYYTPPSESFPPTFRHFDFWRTWVWCSCSGWRCLELGDNPTKKGPRNRADSMTTRLNLGHYVLSPDTSLLTTP